MVAENIPDLFVEEEVGGADFVKMTCRTLN